MNNFFNSCKRCINPWIVGVILIIIIGLIIFVPIVGVASLIAALPLIGCIAMCGGMMFMTRKGRDNKQEKMNDKMNS